MVNFIKYIFFFGIIFFIGCAKNPSITKYGADLVLKDIDVNRSDYMRNISLDLKKNNNAVAMWFLYYPEDIVHIPLANPQIILKTFIPDNSINKTYKLCGFAHQYFYWLTVLYGKSEVSQLGSAESTFKEFTYESLRHIWEEAYQYKNIYSMVIGFDVSNAIFNEMSNQEKVEFLIETRAEPLTIILTKKELLKLIEFKQACHI